MNMSVFEKLYEINVNEHVEQKGNFSYLSWAWAVAELRKASPTATWEVVKHNGLPFCATSAGYFVEVAVTVDGITLSQIHPVLDNNNKPIPSPNAFQINTSIQRCLVKAIALHGLGLYIYAGEDLPDIDPVPTAFSAELREVALKGTLALTEYHNANKSKPGYKEVWEKEGKAIKAAALLADKPITQQDQQKEAA
jgi:hypothetical protein